MYSNEEKYKDHLDKQIHIGGQQCESGMELSQKDCSNLVVNTSSNVSACVCVCVWYVYVCVGVCGSVCVC